MRDPKIILDILNKRSVNNLTLDNIYPILYKESIYLMAYKDLHNQQNITINDKVNKRINNIINNLRYERFKWYKYDSICNQYNINFNMHLCIDKWNSILLQRVLYLILNSIYEPKFLDSSHGWRTNYGVHTALQRISQKSQACEFFIQYDIKDCFEHVNFNTLLQILSKSIKDNRFLNLLNNMFRNNVFGKDLIYNTYSGVIGNTSLSCLLMNVYLNELDVFIQDKIVPIYHNDLKRQESKEYRQLRGKISNEKKKLNRPFPRMTKEESIKRLKTWKKDLRNISFTESIDITKSRRLCYTRYGNSILISFTGPFKEAILLRDNIKDYILNTLHLSPSENINYIVKSNNERNPVRFLNHNIVTQWNNTHITNGKRSLVGNIAFLIPRNIIINKKRKYIKNGKPIHLTQYLASSSFDIIIEYQHDFSEFCQYYKFARNQELLTIVKYIMECSLTKTLANKFKISVKKVYKRFSSFKTVDNFKYKVLAETIIDKQGNEHIAYFGAIPFKRRPFKNNSIIDIITYYYSNRNSLKSKIINKECEICKSTENVQLHHINHIKTIDNKKPKFIQNLIALKRKTIALCENCHRLVHNGLYDGDRLNKK